MSSSPKIETRLANPSDLNEAKKLRSILFDAPSPLTLTPIQVFLFSISFIFMVFMSHILSRIFPKVLPTQLFIAMMIITVSIGISLHLNKNRQH